MSMKGIQKWMTLSSKMIGRHQYQQRAGFVKRMGITNNLMRTATCNFTATTNTTIDSMLQRQHQQRTMSSSSSSTSPLSLDIVDETTSLEQLRTSIGGGDYLKILNVDNPYYDVVQYTHMNRIFNIRSIEYNAEALAIGIVENGLQPGDIVLSFLPENLNETMILQFACSKAGLILYNIDPMIAVNEGVQKARDVLKAALTITQANIYISFEAWNDVNYVRIGEDVVPELRFFDYTTGMPFISPRFPHLRFCIHTGFDQHQKWGWLPLRHMIVPSNNLDTHIDCKSITNKTPLAGIIQYDTNGIPISLGKSLTNQEVYDKKHWPTYCKVLERDFHVVEGLGVTM